MNLMMSRNTTLLPNVSQDLSQSDLSIGGRDSSLLIQSKSRKIGKLKRIKSEVLPKTSTDDLNMMGQDALVDDEA